jgi:hypothetical protein
MVSSGLEGWTGLAINITRREEAKNSRITITGRQIGEGIDAEYLFCKLPEETFILNITSVNGEVSLWLPDQLERKPCGHSLDLNLSRTFFSFIGTSYDGIGDMDIYDVSTRAIKPVDDVFEIDETSRREISIQQGKLEVVRPTLPVASRILKEMQDSSLLLGQKDETQTDQDIRSLFLELQNRLGETLSASALEDLIHATLAANLLKAEKKIEKRRTAFAGISGELDSLKTGVTEKLNWLNGYLVEVMTEAKKGAMETLDGFFNMTKENAVLAKEAKARANEARASFWPTLLYVVALMEFVCYLAFLMVQRKRTKGFRKLE